MSHRRARSSAALALVLVATGVVMGGCESDATDNQQDAERNALTADPSNTRDRPGTPSTATGGSSTSAPDATPSRTGTGEGTPTATAERGTEDDEDAEVVIPAAVQDLAFTKTRVVASPGRITLTMANPSSTPHNIAVDRPEKTEGEVVGKGGSRRSRSISRRAATSTTARCPVTAPREWWAF